jgi:hypothetical protein
VAESVVRVDTVPGAVRVTTWAAGGRHPTSTTFELPGCKVERTLGLSWGLIVRSVG